MKQTTFALVDCNNFFVSCERIFRPDLEGKPVVVLSSNDGCAVARSNEAKALGIPMGAPVFKYRELFRRHGVVSLSANFELYGDIARRITAVLSSITPHIEIYSIDESFLDLSELPIDDYAEWGRIVRENILKWVGVPVSIGIAPTKTLAKLASDRAKKQLELDGVLDIASLDRNQVETYLKAVPVEDIWGVGRRLAPKLRAEGASSALDLARMRAQHAQKLMGIHGRHMVTELNGISCFPLEEEGKVQKSISRTRTFGEDTNDFNALEAAIASFAAQAAYRLRASNQRTRKAALFLTTNKHKPGYRRWVSEVKFDAPTADSGLIISSLVAELEKLYNASAFYHRAGVLLYDFAPLQHLQTDLLGIVDVPGDQQAIARMEAVDSINNRFGKRKVRYAAEDLGNKWQPRRRLSSPRYVSSWDELPTTRIITSNI